MLKNYLFNFYKFIDILIIYNLFKNNIINKKILGIGLTVSNIIA